MGRPRRPNLGGAFGEQQTIGTVHVNPRTARIGDLDGDGLVDVMSVSGASNPNARTMWAQNLGGGSFAAPTRLLPQLEDFVAFGFSDYDEDGTLDLVTATDARLRRMVNLGGGVFQKHLLTKLTNLPAASVHSAMGATITAGDVDGNGHDDLVFVYGTCAISCSSINYTPHVVWRPNLGGGQFGPFEEIVLSTAYDVLEYSVDSLEVKVRDLDADGDGDLLVSVPTLTTIEPDRAGELLWLENTGAGFAPEVSVVSHSLGSLPFEAIDLDLDADLDLIVATDLGVATRFENTGAGFVRRADLPLRTDGAMEQSAACDVDADGDDDFVVTGDGLWWWENPAL